MRDGDARALHRRMEAVVGHHRHGHPVAAETPALAQVQRRERHQLVAVDDLAAAVDRQHAVAVAVEREPERVSARDHRAGEHVEVRGAAAGVDVAAVGRVGDHRHARAETPEDLRRNLVGGAVGAVEQHVHAAEVELAEADVQLAQIVLGCAAQLADAPDRGGIGARLSRAVELALDRQLGLVGELVAVAGEELDAVVAVGVVRGGDHDGQVEAVAVDQQRRRGRRQHAAEQRVAAGGAHAGGDRRLQHLSRLARVAHDQHLWALDPGVAGGGASERERELRGQELAGDAANAVRPEQRTGHTSLLGIQRASASAWRTADACAPS